MYENNYLASALRSGSLKTGSPTFAYSNDGAISYESLFNGAEKIAQSLLDRGLKPGDRVAAQVEKSLASLQLYLGTILAGGVFLPLNTAYTSSELDYFLSDSEPHTFVCDEKRLTEAKMLGCASDIANICTLNGDGQGSIWSNCKVQGFQPINRSSDDLAAILYTSGTTGRSKGAMLTHGNLASNALTLADLWEFTPSDILIHALPIFHTHGLFVATNVTLMTGASIRFHRKFDAFQILQDMTTSTVLMGVPTFYVRLLKEKGLKQASSTMRLFVSGSAPLLAETHREWTNQTGHAILERYGMSETNMNSSNPYRGERKPGTVGPPLPGVDIQVVDPETRRTLGDGEIGSIEVRGPNVFSGYWRMPEKTAEDLHTDGFFTTGDLGCFDEDGYLSIIGRSKDLIISGGYNIYPKEIESLIDELEGVEESAVIGVPHEDFGEAVVALVVRQPGAELSIGDISKALSQQLARFKQPKAILFVDQLPRNTMGKVQKNVLRDTHSTALQTDAVL